MYNQVVVSDELHVVEYLVVSNEIVEIVDYEDLHMFVDMDLKSYVVAKMIEDMYVFVDVEFDVVGVDSLVTNLVLDLHDVAHMYVPDCLWLTWLRIYMFFLLGI